MFKIVCFQLENVSDFDYFKKEMGYRRPRFGHQSRHGCRSRYLLWQRLCRSTFDAHQEAFRHGDVANVVEPMSNARSRAGNFAAEPREGMIIDHYLIVIIPLGRFYKRPVFSSPLFQKLNNGRLLITTCNRDFQTPLFLNRYFPLM